MATYTSQDMVTSRTTEGPAISLTDRLSSASQSLAQVVARLESFENRPLDQPPSQQGVGPAGLMMVGETIGNQAEHLLELVGRITERLGRM
jgi:hypothetical protein